ncbi:hypothetical protein [uncultured Devosia sp.]|uniref:hypothetical protein n=1 Tax=uncultured Devosia sp. TaxID=211434 RepID=UPI0035CA984A
MSERHVDYAIIGSTPLARLLAGLLASTHGQTVVWAGDSHAAFRLPRGIDLSVGPLTRPDSWAVLAQAVPETVKLLARIGGRTSIQRLDPILFAATPAGQQALAFTLSSALGFGHAVERLPADQFGRGRAGIVLRDAVHLQRDRLEPILDRWLDGMAVDRLPWSQTEITVSPDGGARLVRGDDVTLAGRTILADDEAILAYLPADSVDRLFIRQPMTTILTEPTFAMASRVMVQVDADLAFVQANHRGVIAIGAGDHDRCVSEIGVLLGANRQLRQAGGAGHERLRSRDGAPVMGRVGDGPQVLAGLGSIGAFLAPALARWCTGTARPEETDYFAARLAGRSLSPSIVADYAPAALATA